MQKKVYVIKESVKGGNTYYHHRQRWEWGISQINAEDFFETYQEAEAYLSQIKPLKNQTSKFKIVEVEQLIPMGYHKRHIAKGLLGHISKVKEEIEEYEDAREQGIHIMGLLELADIYGALEAVALEEGITMLDLKKMSDVTKEAFNDGTRTSR